MQNVQLTRIIRQFKHDVLELYIKTESLNRQQNGVYIIYLIKHEIFKNTIMVNRLIIMLSLEEIVLQVQNCRKCQLWQTSTYGVPGEGPVDAKIMFVGQNPGSEEDKTGKPFIGRAGKFLTKTLAEFGIKREEVYITNIVKHTSPENRKPYPDEITACLPYLTQQIALIKPKIIVLLGASAKETPRVEGIKYFEIVHPSAAMRFTKMREKFKIQISELVQQIET